MALRSTKLSVPLAVLTGIGIVAALRWGRPVLMPLALAVLLSFILGPAVSILRRRGLNQALAVGVVVILALSVVALGITGVGVEMTRLAQQLPNYKDNIRKKLLALRAAQRGTPIDKVQQTVKELAGELERSDATAPTSSVRQVEAPPTPAPAARQPKPVPVVVKDENPMAVRWVFSALGPASSVLATVGMVLVLVIFMLLRREELRSRLILLGGLNQLATTTRILREADQRITRYLLAQTMVNSMFGIAIGAGLYGIGLPYALLWGFFAGMMRFIPYVGPWLAALLPVSLALAVFPNWLQPVLVIGLFTVVELVTNMLLEPLFYGHTAGVSEVALLVALAFWTWAWGPVGLVLGTPLTVCLVVLAKYVPALEFIPLLMGDERGKDMDLIYYERLLAGDTRGAEEILQEHLQQQGAEATCDRLLLPALVYSQHDHAQGRMGREREQSIRNALGEALSRIQPEPESAGPGTPGSAPSAPARVCAVPLEGDADELALRILQKSLSTPDCRVDVLSSRVRIPQAISRLRADPPDVVCLAGLLRRARSRRHWTEPLRDFLPDGKLVIGCLGLKDGRKHRTLRGLSPHFTGITLAELRQHILQACRSAAGRSTAEQSPDSADNSLPAGRLAR